MTTGLTATLTIDEAARLLGISRGSAYRYAGEGELAGVPVIRVGKRLLIPRAPFLRALGLREFEDPQELAATLT